MARPACCCCCCCWLPYCCCCCCADAVPVCWCWTGLDTSAAGAAERLLFGVSGCDGTACLADTAVGAVTIESTGLLVAATLSFATLGARGDPDADEAGGFDDCSCSTDCSGDCVAFVLVVESCSSLCTHSGCSLRLLCRDDIHGGLAWVKRLCLLLANTSCMGGMYSEPRACAAGRCVLVGLADDGD